MSNSPIKKVVCLEWFCDHETIISWEDTGDKGLQKIKRYDITCTCCGFTTAIYVSERYILLNSKCTPIKKNI
jgi:hypothetical protein